MMQIIKLLLASPLAVFLFIFIFFAVFPNLIIFLRKKNNEKTKTIGLFLFLPPVFLFCIAVWYFFSNIFLDVISPSIVSISWVFARGGELYHELSAPFIYSLLYGPTSFLVNAFFLSFFGPSFLSAKIAGVGSLFASFFLSFFSLGSSIRKKSGLILVSLFAGLCLLFWTFSFEGRPDALALFFVSLALFGVTRKSELAAVLFSGVALGASVDLKVSGIFYFLPIFAIMWKQFRFRTVLVAVCIGVLVSLLPFVLFSNINLFHYLEWLKNAGMHPLDSGSFSNNVAYSVFLLIPFLPALFSRIQVSKKDRFEISYLLTLLLGMLFTSILAAKAGSGQNHLMPFIPLILFGIGFFYSNMEIVSEVKKNINIAFLVFVPFILTVLFLSTASSIRMMRLLYLYPVHAEADIQAIIKKYPSSEFFMGYSDSGSSPDLNTNLPSFRPMLVFAGSPYILDKPALADLSESGASLSSDFLERFKNCNGKIWLFSRGTKPFEGVLGYGKPIFSSEFSNTFFENYEQAEPVGFYDVWVCKEKLFL